MTTRCVSAAHRCRLVLALMVTVSAATACLPDPVPWVPSTEDSGPDSGPDPATCEARGTCEQVVK